MMCEGDVLKDRASLFLPRLLKHSHNHTHTHTHTSVIREEFPQPSSDRHACACMQDEQIKADL